MVRAPLLQPGVQDGQSHSRQKARRKKIAPLTNAARLRLAQALQLTDPHTRMVVAARSVALFGLAGLGLGKCKACQRLAMQSSLF